QTSLKAVRVERRQHAADRVVRGDAVFELQKFAKPVVPLPGKLLDLGIGLAPGHRRAERDEEDVEQGMLLVASVGAGVFEVVKNGEAFRKFCNHYHPCPSESSEIRRLPANAQQATTARICPTPGQVQQSFLGGEC